MKRLSLYSDYERRDVHGMFAPGTPFTERAGAWGNHGVVRVPGRPGDWVFFVTDGQTVGKYKFEEGVSSDGVLTWQSQASQDLDDKRIKEWINHDDLKHSIYLFMRKKEGVPYTYLGKLKYLSHDTSSKKPVHFKWQILDWQMDPSTAARIDLDFKDTHVSTAPRSRPADGLVEVNPPEGRGRTGEKTREFKAKKADFSEIDARNKSLGERGEEAVIIFEKNRLANTDAAEKVKDIRHVARIEGDGAGYDVLSFDPDGTELYIEVKTTKGNELSDFYLSANEWAFFNAHQAQFAIYRVCEFDSATGSGKVFVLRGDDIANLLLEPLNFRARIS